MAPSNLTNNWAGISGSSWLPTVTSEYQECEKCHSAYAYGTTPPTSPSGGFAETDQGLEFNPNNQSYYYVEGDLSAALASRRARGTRREP